jgi:hypothetical protein
MQLQAATYPVNCASDGSHAEVYNTTLNQWSCVSVTGGGGGSSALSAITSAIATNTIDNTLFAQTWKWGTITTQTAFSLTTSSLTSGNLFALNDTGTATTGAVISVLNSTNTGGAGITATMTGTTNTGYAGYFNNTSTTGWSVYAPGVSPSYYAGAIGIGTTAPTQQLTLYGTQTGTNQGAPPATGTASTATFRLQPTTVAAGNGETLDFGMDVVNAAASYAWIQATNNTSLGTNYKLALNPNGGNVGIGTTTPSSLLTFNNGSGGVDIENSNGGSGLILQGDGSPSSNTAVLRIVDNSPLWADSQRGAYFQINDSNGHKAIFFSGVYGNDQPFDRLTFASKLTSFSDNYTANSLPVPTAVVHIISAVSSNVDFKVQGAASQSVDYMQVLSSTSSVLANVTSAGNFNVFGTVKTGGYTVSALPATTTGSRAYVTDQSVACVAAGAALTGSGSVTCPVFYNGTSWVGD